ncbi:MAG: PAS domain S-box protein [Betaproteobacteria bacterium]|nr:PAS domain S-box protein [Betaproteobacteria bacterium]
MVLIFIARLISGFLYPNWFKFIDQLFLVLAWRHYQKSTTVAAFRCDANRLIIDINPLGETLLGYKQGEIRGLGLEDVTYKEDLDVEKKLINDLIKGAFPLLTRYKRYIRKDGKVIPALATLTVKRTFFGCQYFGFIQLTENNLNYQRIANQALASVSHEIRHSLQNIMSLAHYLLNNNHSPSVLNPVHSMLQSTEQISHILDYFYSSQFTYPPIDNRLNRPFQPYFLIENLLIYYQVKAEEKKLKWKTSFTGTEILEVQGNDVYLQQIIHNLLTNAIENTNKGSVEIDCQLIEHSSDSHALLIFTVKNTAFINDAIKDTGSVLKDDPELTNLTKGLGLSIINRLVRLMKGTLRVESFIHGTQITLELLFHKTQHNHTSSVMISKNSQPLKILILDDDDLHVWLLKKMMVGINCLVTNVHSVEEARNALLSNQFDLLIFDLSLHMDNSSELIKELYDHKESYKFKNIFVVTGFDPQSDELVSISPLVDRVFTKPVNQQHFLKEIQGLSES